MKMNDYKMNRQEVLIISGFNWVTTKVFLLVLIRMTRLSIYCESTLS